jgi:hypothetical protein
MFPKYVVAAALAAAFGTLAAAQADKVYYIVQDTATKRCTIVEQRPATPIGAFATRAEAEAAIKTMAECTGR